MMNANRATALPWNIYGDQRDSLALLDHGWIQVYAEDNQEALDLALMAYAVAEDARCMRTPVMVNLDGFALTHTYETVDVPAPEQADAFLPPYDGSGNRFDFEHPVNIGFSAGPEYNRYFKYWEHRDMLEGAPCAIEAAEARFAEVFGRRYPGMIERLNCDDADVVLVTLALPPGLRAAWWRSCARRACARACCASATCARCRARSSPRRFAARVPWAFWRRTCRSARRARCSRT